MYQLYIGNKNYSSWSLRPWVLLRELAIPFEEHVVPFEPGSSWAKFRAFSPSGRVPCLVDAGTVAWDSLGIVEYLAERHPGVWPREDAARTWARCASAEMHSGFATLRNRCSMNVALKVRLHQIEPALRRDVERVDELWSEGLSRFGGSFLAGDAFTAVDAFFAPVAFRVATYGLPLGEPASAYAARLLALPSMQDWKRAALLEPWREADHEADAAANGTIVEDLRATAPPG
jgi:glutathione S-transferase